MPGIPLKEVPPPPLPGDWAPRLKEKTEFKAYIRLPFVKQHSFVQKETKNREAERKRERRVPFVNTRKLKTNRALTRRNVAFFLEKIFV